MRVLFSTAIIVGALWVSDSAAQTPAYRWQEKPAFFCEMTRLQVEKNRIDFQTNEIMTEVHAVVRCKCVKATPAALTVEMQVLKARTRSRGGVRQGMFDQLEGHTFVVTLDHRHRPTATDGLAPLARTASAATSGPAFEAAVKTFEKPVHTLLEQLLPPLTCETGAVGETWSAPGAAYADHLMVEREFMLQPRRPDGIWPIRLTGRYVVTPADAFQNPILKSNPAWVIASQKLEGMLLVDGRGPTHMQRSLRMHVDSPRGLKGNKADLECDLAWHETVTFSDDDPRTPRPSLVQQAKFVSPATAQTNSLGMRLVTIPPGTCTLGAPDRESRDEMEDTIEVQFSLPIVMGAHEVTIGQFRKFVEETGYRTHGERMPGGCFGFDQATQRLECNPRFSWRDSGWPITDNHPVTQVNWEDAKAFCAWLSKKEGKHYRLPTDAEWEYACRGGTTTSYASGAEPESLVKHGNVVDAAALKLFPQWRAHSRDDGHAFTAPVGSFTPNAFGLYDMHGNALEMCEDFLWHRPVGPLVDPQGPPLGIWRIQRGGGWSDFPRDCTSFRRTGVAQDHLNIASGFRVVLSATPVVQPAFPPTWHGRTVLPKDALVSLGNPLNPGAPATESYLFAPFQVYDEKQGILRIQHGQPAFMLKRDAVLLEDAVAFYTQRLNAQPRDARTLHLRALAWKLQDRHTAALADLDAAIAIDSKDCELRRMRCAILSGQKAYARAQADLEAVVADHPDDAAANQALAWFLATCPDGKCRDGARAVAHAVKARAASNRMDADILDTLAAAYAEAGDFTRAVETLETLLNDPLLTLPGNEAEGRLELYRSKRPYRAN